MRDEAFTRENERRGGGSAASCSDVARVCDRCDVAMTLEPLAPGSRLIAWYCPCCKSRLRTPEMIEESAAEHRAELGMSDDEYRDYCRSFINTDPLPPAQLERMRAFVKEREAEWEPPCEHVSNPWKADG